MPVILVVDDSEVDRRLVAGLLPDDLDWLVEFAGDGTEALDKISLSMPDVVITDMKMPQMDGMELVHNVHTHFPDLPVILITGHGSEELAVEALREGATSYVPKDKLAAKLRETVEQVLDLSRADRSYSRLIGCLDGVEYSFALDSDPMLVPPLVDLVQQMLAAMHCCDATTRMHAGIALEEALLNAVLIGNLELSIPEAQEARERVRCGEASKLVEQRKSESPFCDRATHVNARIALDSARFVVRGRGTRI